MKKAIVIGATSGLGLELAKLFSADGWGVGLAARREGVLKETAASLPGPSWIKVLDATRADEARERLRELIDEMGGADAVVVSAGIGDLNPNLDWAVDRAVIETNVLGFTALCNEAFNYFASRGGGQLVGISSIAGLRGGGDAPSYNASKAFEACYLTGLKIKSRNQRLNVIVTDVKPGFVDTPLTRGQRGLIWLVPCGKAARQIYRAILKKKRHVYVSRRWSLIAWTMNLGPEWLYAKIEARLRF